MIPTSLRPAVYVLTLLTPITLGCLVVLVSAVGADDQRLEEVVDSEKPTAVSDVTVQSKPELSGQAESNSRGVVSAEEEAIVMAFVKQHQPDLSRLLAHLKANLPREYSRALRDLNRAVTRLAAFEKRGDERYSLELRRWKAQTRAQLLAARLQNGGGTKYEQALRKTLQEDYDLRLKLLEKDHARLSARAARIRQQIEELSANRESSLEKQLSSLTQSGGDQAVNAKKNKKADDVK